jgi:hypothetical protein
MGCRAMLVAIVLCQALSVGLGLYYVYKNRRRDKLFAETPSNVLNAMSVAGEEFPDRTDMEDAWKSRYRW